MGPTLTQSPTPVPHLTMPRVLHAPFTPNEPRWHLALLEVDDPRTSRTPCRKQPLGSYVMWLGCQAGWAEAGRT
jgi:hypothetical protein